MNDTNRLYYGYDQNTLNEHVLKEFGVVRKKKLYYKHIIYFETKTCFIFYLSHKPDVLEIISQLIGAYHCSSGTRHIVILLNLEEMGDDNSKALKVILEKFHRTTLFIATTSNISAIEHAIKSRFYLVRISCQYETPKKVLYKKEWNNLKTVKDVKMLSSRICSQSLPDIIKSIMSFIKEDEIKMRFLEKATQIESSFLNMSKWSQVKIEHDNDGGEDSRGDGDGDGGYGECGGYGRLGNMYVMKIDKRYFIELLVLEAKMMKI